MPLYPSSYVCEIDWPTWADRDCSNASCTFPLLSVLPEKRIPLLVAYPSSSSFPKDLFFSWRQRGIPPSLSSSGAHSYCVRDRRGKIEARSILLPPPIWQRAKIKGNRGKLGLLLRKKEEEGENPEERNLEGNLMNT